MRHELHWVNKSLGVDRWKIDGVGVGQEEIWYYAYLLSPELKGSEKNEKESQLGYKKKGRIRKIEENLCISQNP